MLQGKYIDVLFSFHTPSVDGYFLYICYRFKENLKGDEMNNEKRVLFPKTAAGCPPEQFLYLHGHREVVLGFWRKENIHSFLWKWLIPSRWSPNFNNVQLEVKQTKRRQI